MRDALRKVLVVMLFMVFAFVFCPGSIHAASINSTELTYGENGTITRAEWIHNLVVLFDMTIDEVDYPDNYYSDLTAESNYYAEIMMGVEFGLIDLPAGSEFRPDEPVTRDFAAYTLNYCLGYSVEEGITYSFVDVDDVAHPEDAHIAVERGWIALSNNQFMPDAYLTSAEAEEMCADAIAINESIEVDENYDNQFEYKEGVIVVPETTEILLDGEDKVIVYDVTIDIQDGDEFAVFLNGLPKGYVAEEVQIEEDCLVITVSELDDGITDIDAQGVVEGDLGTIQPANGNKFILITEETEEGVESVGASASAYGLTRQMSAARISGKKKVSGLKLDEIMLPDGQTIPVSLTISNVVVSYNVNVANKEAMVAVTADVKSHASAKLSASTSTVLGTIPIGGVGEVTIIAYIDVTGKISITFSTTAECGFQYDPVNGFRTIRSFRKTQFCIATEINMDMGYELSVSATSIPFVSAKAYFKTGVNTTILTKHYEDGKTPNVCRNISSFVYADAGAKASIKFINREYNQKFIVIDEENSPCRLVYHFEDEVPVGICTRNPYGWYSSKYNSRYGTLGAYGFDGDGKVVPVYTYTVGDDGTATITGYTGSASVLCIPDEVDGYAVRAIGDSAFKNRTDLQIVDIPDCVTSIGKNAFNGCVYLTNITLPNNSNYTYIDEGVLANTSSLRNVEMSDFITEIRKQAFYQSGLVSLHLNENITYIANKAFFGCKDLSDLVLPKYLEKFGDSCFGDCDALKSVEIPRYIIGCDDLYPNSSAVMGYTSPSGMFSGCDNLKKVTFTNGITNVGTDLFNNCTGLEEISFPDTVTEIQSKAFYNCTNLKKVNLPNSLTKIGILSFAGCVSLEEVYIPDAVTVIDCSAFRWCENLSDVKLPSRLKEIGTWAFGDCTSLQELEIPKNVSNVIRYYDGFITNRLESPFVGCNSLKKVVLPDGMESIPSNLFRGCTTGLEEVVIPDSVTKIGKSAFNSCRSLKTIKLPDNLVSIEETAFIDCSSLETIEIPDTVNSMGTSVFEDCSSLKEVKLPKYRIAISSGTFKNCISLSNIEFPDSLQYIYSNAFEGCEKLEKIIVPKEFKGVESQAFKNCKRLTSVELNGYYISNNAFEGCLELADVKMNNSIYSLGKAAFLNCSNLKKIQLSTSLKEIPANAFEGCTFLNDLVIPYGVTLIGDGAFKNCTSLKNITIPKNITKISSNAFSYPEEVTVYGVAGSYAEEYAKDNDMIFVAQDIKVESVDFSQTEFIVNRGSTVKIPIEILPENCNEEVVWTSSNEEIATVNSTGTIKGENVGECEITVSIGEISRVCKVIVKQEHVGLKLNAKTELIIGENMTVKCISSDNIEVKSDELRWWSSNPRIATVDQNGVVTAFAKGTVTIEVWLLENTELKESIDIEIIESKNPDDSEKSDEPNIPNNPDVPQNPDDSEKSNEPNMPNNPDVPQNPDDSEKSDEPDVPNNPDVPQNPDDSEKLDESDMPNNPDVPQNPDDSESSDKPDIPSEPDIPQNPDDSEASDGSNASKQPSSNKVTLRPLEITSVSAYTDSITFKWKSDPEATGFEIQYSVNADLSNSKKGYWKGGYKSYVLDGLLEGTTYYYRIRAYKGSGDACEYSEWTAIMSKQTTVKTVVKPKTQNVFVPKIKLKKVKSTKKKEIKISWKYNVYVSGYQISFSRYKSFSKAKTKNINNWDTNCKAIKGLSEGKIYYVRIRAFVKDSTGKKVYGKWSGIKKVKVKK